MVLVEELGVGNWTGRWGLNEMNGYVTRLLW